MAIARTGYAASGLVNTDANTGSFDITVPATGLDPGTEYWWKVRAGVTV
jgi:hypothetical protein